MADLELRRLSQAIRDQARALHQAAIEREQREAKAQREADTLYRFLQMDELRDGEVLEPPPPDLAILVIKSMLEGDESSPNDHAVLAALL